MLDIFREMEHNIDTELKKWVYLFGADTPEKIMKAAGMSEEFFGIIRDVSGFCMNVDEVMGMFSEILREMDRETEREMWDQTLIELNDAKTELSDTKSELNDAKTELSDTRSELNDAKTELSDTKSELNDAKSELKNTKEKLNQIAEKLIKTQKFTTEEIAELSGLSLDEVESMKK